MNFTLLDTKSAAGKAIFENLNLPELAEDGRVHTLNSYGSMKVEQFSYTANKFIEIAKNPHAKVLEIGTAYGEPFFYDTCIKALHEGATDYTGIDIEEKHLKILARRIYENLKDRISNVKLICASTPNEELNGLIEANSMDAILIDSVMQFIEPTKILDLLNQIYTWLKPGGKIFASLATYYMSVFKPEARQRLDGQINSILKNADPTTKIDSNDLMGMNCIDFPGDFDFSKFPEEERRFHMDTFSKFHGFNIDTTRYFFEKAGFIIDEIFYMSLDLFVYKLDEREYVAIVARK